MDVQQWVHLLAMLTNTELLESCGAFFHPLRNHLEINFLKETCSKDRERAAFLTRVVLHASMHTFEAYRFLIFDKRSIILDEKMFLRRQTLTFSPSADGY